MAVGRLMLVGPGNPDLFSVPNVPDSVVGARDVDVS